MKTTKAGVVLAVVLAAGCELGLEEVSDEELGQTEQQACSYNCGGFKNGIRQLAWNSVAGDGFKPYRLAAYGAGSSYGPYSICEGTYAGGCVVREGWIRWATDNYSSSFTRTLRTEVFNKMLAIIGGPGQVYYDRIESIPLGRSGDYFRLSHIGEWGLAPHALYNSWSYTDMERVTGGLILMLNAREVHVEVALRTPGVAPPSTQSNPGDFIYEEAIAYGNVFKGKIAAIAGGYHARNPLLHARYSEMNPDSATDVFEFDPDDTKNVCKFSGSPTNHLRYSPSCVDHYGTRWYHPVSARLRYMDPSWSLTGTVTVTKPGGGFKTVSVY